MRQSFRARDDRHLEEVALVEIEVQRQELHLSCVDTFSASSFAPLGRSAATSAAICSR